MIRTTLRFALAAALGLGPVACAVDGDQKPTTDDTKTDDSDTKAESWTDSGENPNGFASNLEYKLSALPRSGEAANKPWASTYWPTYEDNINYRWDGSSSDSAVKKYEKAFGGTNLEDKVSAAYGIDRYKSRTACTSDSQCDSAQGEGCAKRAGQSNGYCIPTWWGICHAWSPLAVMMPEPKHAVTYNGVTFKVMDIKGLMSIAFNSTDSKFVSTRCEENPNDLARDTYGRPTATECRNTNAATVHLLATNFLGLRHQGFVEDRTLASEVWNQPVRSYEITQQDKITARQANELIGVRSAGGRNTTANGSVAKDAWYHNAAIAVTAGEGFTVTMTGSNDADLYVNFGSQPTDTAYACRPYSGGSAEECALTVPAGATQAFVSVKGYAATSNFNLSMTAGGGTPDAYVFNSQADTFYHVKMRLDYITESSASTDGYIGDNPRYIAHDNYEYVLELKGDSIIGGEWVGSSKTTHPDFLWLPTGRRDFSIANGALSYAKIKMIYDMSVDASSGGGSSDGLKSFSDAGAIAKNAWKNYGPFEVATSGKITVTLSGDNDADLYVRKGTAPTASTYDCRPYKNGSDEACTLVGGGTYYVGVRGYAANSNFSVTVEYDSGSGGGGTVDPPPATLAHINTQGSVAQGEMKYFTLAVPAGHKVVIKTFSEKDVDLYLQMNAQPTTDAYLMRAWTTSGNETLTYTPSSNGTLNIGVHGYEAGSFTLRTSDN